MGYDLHITRAEDWAESGETPITPDEWKSYVDAAPDLVWDSERPWTHMETDLAVWTGHPPHAWLALLDGQVETKNPDEAMRKKMHEIATALGARVQGDDGEWYGADGNVVVEGTRDEEGQFKTEPWSADAVASVIADLETKRQRGDFEDWLVSFEGILDCLPEEVARWVEATHEFKARNGARSRRGLLARLFNR
jgi:hypothetical protein